ncbi:hypothetical protein N9H18_03085, partial [Candidatus Thioglobus sp.]|nr:hypothetical protein [Candidatus Thioglobus sp.]
MRKFSKILVLLSCFLTMIGSSHALQKQTIDSIKFESSIQKNGKVIFEGANQFTKFDFRIPLNRSGALLVGFKDVKVLNDKRAHVRTHIRYGNIDFSVGICFQYYDKQKFMAARTSFNENDWGGLTNVMPSSRCIGKWELDNDSILRLGELGIYALMDDIQQNANTRKLLEVLDEQTNGSLCFILTNIISKENCVKISETETVDTEESIEKELVEFEAELSIELFDNLFSSVDDFSVAVSKRKAEVAAAKAKRLSEERASKATETETVDTEEAIKAELAAQEMMAEIQA